ncbi:hypothetical protein WR43_12210 [Mycolicibacter arupensis]|uniref:DOD-type homing endonuclease domain-containing protein n=1 Tax=Mycolicibacter arupensis TaxID=342002 RepID=A0A0F5MY03_9MYCO|nr:hypothetical protein WR43_12210 [Mycolicibacter arupensis]OQZ96598.1 hypothetical protein BST15_11900 [Mycolicibacter arupensis]
MSACKRCTAGEPCEFEHGRAGYMRHRCRCAVCSAAQREYSTGYRARVSAQQRTRRYAVESNLAVSDAGGISVDTPMPTPTGWTTVGQLQSGDLIFGSDGSPVQVVDAPPAEVGFDCYEVMFAGGQQAGRAVTSTVVSGDHLWLTEAVASAAQSRVRTTREMAEDGRKFAIPRAAARQTPTVDLPVDPYLLGVWLGDGSTGACNVTSGWEDVEELERQLASRGIHTHRLRSGQNAARLSFSGAAGYQAADRPSPAIRLREIECFRSKQIPVEYMWSGTEQRLELLRGLMDTDGCATTSQQCVFIGRRHLAEDVVELLRGLGQLPTITFVTDARSLDGGYYRVVFTAWRIQPFAFARKAGRVHGTSRNRVTIASIRAVKTVPTRRIEVDATDRLYQAGPMGHLIHNTQVADHRRAWRDAGGQTPRWKKQFTPEEDAVILDKLGHLKRCDDAPTSAVASELHRSVKSIRNRRRQLIRQRTPGYLRNQ